jgi:hypothetical protein
MCQNRSLQQQPENLGPIPTSLERRWELVRIRVLPVVVFVVSLCAIVCMWREYILVPALHNSTKPILVNVRSNETSHPALMNVTEAPETQPTIGSVRPLDSLRPASNGSLLEAMADSEIFLKNSAGKTFRKRLDLPALFLRCCASRWTSMVARTGIEPVFQP